MTDADNVTGSECEICTKPLHRVYSSPAVQFKGPGFYSTRG
jgi:predicted nucleic acid-binding Zn ribbon protein